MINKEWTPIPFKVLEQGAFWSPFAEASHKNGKSFKVLDFTGVVNGSNYGYTFSVEFSDGTRYSADIAELNGDYRYGRSGYAGDEVLPPESYDPIYQQCIPTDELLVTAHKDAAGKVTHVVMENKNAGVLLARCDFTHGDVYYVASPLAAPTAQGICRNAMTARYYEATVYNRMAVSAYAPQAWLYAFETTHRQSCIDFGTEVLRNCKALVVCGTTLSAGMRTEISEAIRLGIHIIYETPSFCLDDISIGEGWFTGSDNDERYISIPIHPYFDMDEQLGTAIYGDNENTLEMYCIYYFDEGRATLHGYTTSSESESGITGMDFHISKTFQSKLIAKIRYSCEAIDGVSLEEYVESEFHTPITPSDRFWQKCEKCGFHFKVKYTTNGIEYIDGENVCNCEDASYHPVNDSPSYSQWLESQNIQPVEERIFSAIDSALEAAGFRVLDGDRDSVIIKDQSSGCEYEIYVKEVYPDDFLDVKLFEPEHLSRNQSNAITGRKKALSYYDFITKCRMMDEACRQWCVFIDESPERRDGTLFTEFYDDICKQKYAEYLADPRYREDCDDYASYSNDERLYMVMRQNRSTSLVNDLPKKCFGSTDDGKNEPNMPRYGLEEYVEKPIDAESEQGRESLFLQILDYTSHVSEFTLEDIAFVERYGFKPETFNEFLER